VLEIVDTLAASSLVIIWFDLEGGINDVDSDKDDVDNGSAGSTAIGNVEDADVDSGGDVGFGRGDKDANNGDTNVEEFGCAVIDGVDIDVEMVGSVFREYHESILGGAVCRQKQHLETCSALSRLHKLHVHTVRVALLYSYDFQGIGEAISDVGGTTVEVEPQEGEALASFWHGDEEIGCDDVDSKETGCRTRRWSESSIPMHGSFRTASWTNCNDRNQECQRLKKKETPDASQREE
jgi:hypothetical protein